MVVLQSVLIVVLLIPFTGARMDLFGIGETVSGLMNLGGRIWERDQESDFLHDQRMGNEAMAREMADRNERLQREFAQHGIQWRVQDAKAAGVHPVWSLSGGGAAFSPSATVTSGGSPGNFGIGEAMGRMGQSISRAVSATEDPMDRSLKRLQVETAMENLRGMRIENDKKLGLHRVGEPVSPGIPNASSSGLMTGAGNVAVQADQPTSSDDVDPSVTAADARSAFSRYVVRDADGNLTTVMLPSKDASEPLESMEPLGGWLTIMDNLNRDPELIWKMRHLVPFGKEFDKELRALWDAGQSYLNWRKRQAAARDIARRHPLYEYMKRGIGPANR